MGSFLFIWVLSSFFFFFRGIDSASCPETFSKVSLFLLTYSSAFYLFIYFLPSLCSRPFISFQISPNLPGPLQHSSPLLAPSPLLHSLIHLSPLVLTPLPSPASTCCHLFVLCPSPICDPPSLPLSCPMAHVLDLHL